MVIHAWSSIWTENPGNPLLVSPDALKTGTHAGTGPRGCRPPFQPPITDWGRSVAQKAGVFKYAYLTPWQTVNSPSFYLCESGVVEQVALWRGSFRRELCLRVFGLLLSQVFQNLPDYRRVFDAGDDLHRPPALLAGFDVDVEYPLQALGPGHGGVAFGRRSVIRMESVHVLVASPAPPRWRDGGTVSAVGSEHPMKSRQVDPGLWHQSGQSCNKVQRFEDHVGGTVSERRLQLVAYLAARGE